LGRAPGRNWALIGVGLGADLAYRLMELLDAVVHLLFAFDLGYEIDLDRARQLLPGESGPLARRRRTPESIRYRPAPLRIPMEPPGEFLPGGSLPVRPSRAELALFDFGAASLEVAFPARTTAAALLEIAATLGDCGPLNAAARNLVTPLLECIRPAVNAFELSELNEEYVVFELGGLEPERLRREASWVAGLVRLESGPLSAEEVAEATRLSLSYTPNDLVVLDWAAGVVADRDCAETLQVIEFANVQLLEYRHIDDRLDDRLEAAYRLIRPPDRRRRAFPPWRSHNDAVRSVRELEIEATSLFERAENALKLIGDQYLSRIYGLASTRFHLGDWQQSIRRKLDTVGDVYDLLVQQAGGMRMEILEMIVVVLIAVEIVLAVLRH
jgi:hypothetical protein